MASEALTSLFETLPQIGTVQFIGLADRPRGEITSVAEVQAEVGTGLHGDHHSIRRPGGKRQVTLIQWEHLPAVASLAGLSAIAPAQLRRNIAVSGINLLALKDRQFAIGDAILEYTGPCAPCGRMEEILGPGGFNAMRGHGGITARVIREGHIRCGDRVQALPRESGNSSSVS